MAFGRGVLLTGRNHPPGNYCRADAIAPRLADGLGEGSVQGLVEFAKTLGAPAYRRDGRRHHRADRLLRISHHARNRAADDAAVHRPVARGFRRHRQGARPRGRPLRTAQRRQHHHGAERPCRAAAHDARRERPAQGRRRRLRDFRQVGRARHHELHAEYQQSARARGRARAHHPRRSTASRPRGCTW